MTSKERVRRAIRFEEPDRIPYFLPEPYPTDIIWIFPNIKSIKYEIRENQRYRLSHWNSWWLEMYDENMGEVVEPAIKHWEDLVGYNFPKVNEPESYSHAKDIISENSDKYVMGVLSVGLLFSYMEIRGLLNFFTDLYDETENMEKLLDKLVEMQMESVEIWSELNVDGIVVGFDDWGLQDRLMIDPEFFRKYFKPRYEKVWKHIRSKGMDVILHSCGEITSILDDMIEAGLSVINMDQQENIGLDRLSAEFKGKICFWNPVDIQTVMVNGTPKEVDAYVLKMIKALGSSKGGFIGKYYPQPKGVGHEPEKSKASFDAFIKYENILVDMSIYKPQ